VCRVFILSSQLNALSNSTRTRHSSRLWNIYYIIFDVSVTISSHVKNGIGINVPLSQFFITWYFPEKPDMIPLKVFGGNRVYSWCVT